MNQAFSMATENLIYVDSKGNCASENLGGSDKKKNNNRSNSNKMVQVSELLALNSEGSVKITGNNGSDLSYNRGPSTQLRSLRKSGNRPLTIAGALNSP